MHNAVAVAAACILYVMVLIGGRFVVVVAVYSGSVGVASAIHVHLMTTRPR